MDTDKLKSIVEQIQSNNANADIPAWAHLLFECMSELSKQLDIINVLSSRIQILEDQHVIHNRVTEELTNHNDILKDRLKSLTRAVDDQEQRSRNMCLLFHGIVETEDEDTDQHVINTIKNELEIEMGVGDIQRSHRLGQVRTQRSTRAAKPRPRPIIMRFSDYRKRREVFTTKRKLKGKAVSITENLTQTRLELLKAATEKYGKGNAWTVDGRITIIIGKKKSVITCHEDMK